jgi:hypothetical protein
MNRTLNLHRQASNDPQNTPSPNCRHLLNVCDVEVQRQLGDGIHENAPLHGGLLANVTLTLTAILSITSKDFLKFKTLTLDVCDVRMQRQPGDGVHEDALPHGGPPPPAPLEEHGRLHVDEWQGDELGDATCPLLEVPKMEQVAGPVT